MPRIAARVERLTRNAIRELQPRASRYRVRDQDSMAVGLNILVRPDGRKIWTVRYVSLDGRETEKHLGYFPTLLPAQARIDAAMLIGKLKRDNLDPIAAQRKLREEASAKRAATFDRWADKCEAASKAGTFNGARRPKAESTLAKDKLYLKRHVRPVLGGKPIGDIRRTDVVSLVEKVAENSGYGAANTTLQVIRRVFAYARHHDEIEYNPALEIPPFPMSARDIVADDGQIRKLWLALDAYRAADQMAKGSQARSDARTTARALQFAFLTLQRRGEVARMHKDQVDFEKAFWTIPALNKKERRKGGVPLSPWAKEILLEAFREGGSDWAFPARDKSEHLDPKVMTRFMARLRENEGIDDLTVHDLRRTGRTRLTGEELQIDEVTAERVLNHSVGRKQQQAYDWNAYTKQKREALEAWAVELKRIVESAAVTRR